jgi:hypothetical protein
VTTPRDQSLRSFDHLDLDVVAGHSTPDEHDPTVGAVGEGLTAGHEPLRSDAQ